MVTTSSQASSEASSQISTSSSESEFPPVPDHIIVTFDGKVRELLRITRDAVDAVQPRRPRTSRPRYYASKAFLNPDAN